MKLRTNLLKELINSLKESNISKVYEIFEKLDENKELQQENNLYLYLLSFIEEVPEKYIDRLKKITHEDLLINSENNRYKEISNQNRIRTSIFRAKFHETAEMIEKTNKDTFKDETERELLLTLVILANKKENQVRTKIEYLVKNKEYAILVNYLENKNLTRKLNLYETYVYVLCVTINRITKNNKIPKVLNPNPNNIKEAIMGYNFRMALIFNRQDIAIKYEDSKYVINFLLVEINKLIDNILKESREKIEQEKKLSMQKINKIKDEMTKNNIENALNIIKEYLKDKNKEEYLYLIEKLIKIYILSKDSTYKNVLEILNYINNINYKFDIKYYHSEFYNSLNRNLFDIAQLYLDIINHYQKQYKEDLTDHELEKINSALKNSQDEKQYILTELSQLEKDNEYIKVINKIPQKRRKILIRIANNIKGLSASSAGIKEPKNLILRRVKPDLKAKNEKQLMEEALNMYINKEYNLAIILYMRLLTSMDYVNIKVCEMLGLAHLHLNEKQEALKYLKISKQLVKNFQANRSGIDKLIDLLEKEENEENNQKLNILLTKYDNEIVLFDTDKLEQIAMFMKENNMTIEEGTQKFELEPPQILIIKLIYARYYYMEGMIISGDQMLQEVEKTKPKPSAAINMLNELKENKQIYRTKKRSIH